MKKIDPHKLIAHIDRQLILQDRYSIDELHIPVSHSARQIVEQYISDIRELELQAAENSDVGLGALVAGLCTSTAMGAAIGGGLAYASDGSVAVGAVIGATLGFGTEFLFRPVASVLWQSNPSYDEQRERFRRMAIERLQGHY